jgi:indole-3-glycerol phosphate synthase/phosphoribosylanthranilate isomerase
MTVRVSSVSVLDGIIARKKMDVARRMERAPFESFLESALPSTRSLASALKGPGARFILECKRASPSEGLIRENFDIGEIALSYKNIADAVSVLTDEPYFQGSLEYLRRARELLGCPILAKDFVTCPYQVREARAYGADAALLMLSALDDEMYRMCADEAERLSMDVLTEVHDEDELDRAIALGARLIGINNRNLKTLEVDMGVVERLAPRIPDGITAVCESGVGSQSDVMRIRENCPNVGAFLVGGALMKEERLDLAARRLIYGRVKICGLTSPEDARFAYDSGASYGGIVFADSSPRYIAPRVAHGIVSASPLPMVGVFVNERPDAASEIARSLELAAVQLHGDEDREYAGRLRKALPGVEIWRAVRVGGAAAEKLPAADEFGADRLLFDTFDKNARGGTGKAFDWTLLDAYGEKSCSILAGGVTPENVSLAMRSGVYAADVSSGVEFPASPGKKDRGRVRKLFERLREER